MKRVKVLSIILIMALGIGLGNFSQQSFSLNLEDPIKPVAATQPAKTYLAVNPVTMVDNPTFYLNKNVKFKAKFDKFSTLGLDYKPAFRSSEDYISFLIQRCNITTHNVPLSELKIFLKRNEAEKHIDLNSGDEIEVSGKVFSNALGDVWMDVDKFTVLSTKASTETK